MNTDSTTVRPGAKIERNPLRHYHVEVGSNLLSSDEEITESHTFRNAKQAHEAVSDWIYDMEDLGASVGGSDRMNQPYYLATIGVKTPLVISEARKRTCVRVECQPTN